ncbi:MYND-type domain-containing protein [Mycena chlorophos]|uniref:MYND-type domain-containing protein n=1 Tax=Mycena chlorophos TaxID=658473 RepID=A0A8H6SB31_MYCCL|nr:MYND-type domain-containing protein [Mycena chlorophos]
MHESLRLSALDALPPAIAAAAQAACVGTANGDALAPILEFLESDAAEEGKVLVLPVVYALLDSACIPKSAPATSPEARRVADRAWTALDILHKKEYIRRKAAKVLNDIWPRIMCWLVFFDKYPKLGEESTAALDVFLDILPIFVVRSPESLANDRLLTTPGSVKLLFRGWARALCDASYGGETNNRTDLFFSLFIENVLYAERRGLQEALEGAGGTEQNLAHLLYKHLELCAPDATTYTDNHIVRSSGRMHMALYYLRFITSSIGSPRELSLDQVLATMLEKGLVTLLCNALRTFTTASLDDSDSPMLLNTVIASILIVLALCFHRDPRFIAEAVRQHLLASLLRIAPRTASLREELQLSENSKETWLSVLLGSMLPAAFMRTVVLKAYEDIVHELHNTIERNPDNLVGLPALRNLIALADARVSVLQRYEAGELVLHRGCDNFQCTRERYGPDSSSAFQRCSGCCAVVYCSQACQKEDWHNGGHNKKGCKALREWYQHDAKLNLSPADRDFIRILADHDLAAYKRENPPLERAKFNYGDNTSDFVLPVGTLPCSVEALWGTQAAGLEWFRRARAITSPIAQLALDVVEFRSAGLPVYMSGRRKVEALSTAGAELCRVRDFERTMLGLSLTTVHGSTETRDDDDAAMLLEAILSRVDSLLAASTGSSFFFVALRAPLPLHPNRPSLPKHSRPVFAQPYWAARNEATAGLAIGRK